MDFNTVMNFVQSPAGVSVLGGLLLISEGLALTDKLKANSVLQLVINILGRFSGKKEA